MKKILSLIVCIIFMVSGLSVFVLAQPAKRHHVTEQLVFSPPAITNDETTCTIHFKQTEQYMMDTGKPVLPFKTLTYTFPAGTIIQNIICTPSGVHTKTLDHPLTSASPPHTDAFVHQTRSTSHTRHNVGTTQNSEVYPGKWCAHHVGYGRKDDEIQVMVTLYLFPVQYRPIEQRILSAEELTIEITYQKPVEPVGFPDEYDLLIVSASQYKQALQPFVEHKESHGVDTLLVTMEEVVDEYPGVGKDDAEKLKYFIKDTLEDTGITYVLFVGGRKFHWKEQWDVPVRYSRLKYGDESSYLTDLYFADIYRYEDGRPVFDDWDSNNDGVFAEWKGSKKDVLDLYPDVYVGRWACRNRVEARIMVRKTIQYENNPFSEFNNFLLVGGDSYNDPYDYIEGALATWEAYKQIEEDFTPLKAWASKMNLTAQTIGNMMETGSGFAYFCGHGSPLSWSTHSPNSFDEWEEGLLIFDMPFIRNGNKQPIVVIGGCHNSQFNVTILNSFNKEKVWHGENAPECWSWWLTRKNNGGAIATIGNTGLGYHGDGDSNNDSIADYIQILDGWLEINFFRIYDEGVDTLGELHGQTIREYIDTFPGDANMSLSERLDCKMVQQWCLLGDPSLKIGGYTDAT